VRYSGKLFFCFKNNHLCCIYCVTSYIVTCRQIESFDHSSRKSSTIFNRNSLHFIFFLFLFFNCNLPSSLNNIGRYLLLCSGPGCPSGYDAGLTNQTSLVRFPSPLTFFLFSCDSYQVPKWFGTHFNLEVPL